MSEENRRGLLGRSGERIGGATEDLGRRVRSFYQRAKIRLGRLRRRASEALHMERGHEEGETTRIDRAGQGRFYERARQRQEARGAMERSGGYREWAPSYDERWPQRGAGGEPYGGRFFRGMGERYGLREDEVYYREPYEHEPGSGERRYGMGERERRYGARERGYDERERGYEERGQGGIRRLGRMRREELRTISSNGHQYER